MAIDSGLTFASWEMRRNGRFAVKALPGGNNMGHMNMGHTDMGDARVKGVRVRLEGGRLVDLDQRMLEALIAFASELLKADGAEDELRAIGRTAGELREWLDSAREKPGYGVPAVLLRHVGPELADVEAATEALARVENESPVEENKSGGEQVSRRGEQVCP